mgnify:CR=1 FL=1
MADQQLANSSGVGFLGLLFLVLLTLKLTKVIGWSWWWIIAPLWGPVALIWVVIALIGICAGLMALYNRFTLD